MSRLKCPPVGDVWKFEEGGCLLRYRPRHLTMVRNYERMNNCDCPHPIFAVDKHLALMNSPRIVVYASQCVPINIDAQIGRDGALVNCRSEGIGES
ncbi:hypothetical protein TNCV_1721151 [Trichonephila clavipes]|nr:hypothetical protein TNCV_1721151 [Trichonephila clavipes]